MYGIKIPGCLTFLLILLLIVMLVKELWPLLLGTAVLLIIIYYLKLLYDMFKNKQAENSKYEPKNGEVFKVCPGCEAKVKVSADTCPYCKRKLS